MRSEFREQYASTLSNTRSLTMSNNSTERRLRLYLGFIRLRRKTYSPHEFDEVKSAKPTDSVEYAGFVSPSRKPFQFVFGLAKPRTFDFVEIKLCVPCFAGKKQSLYLYSAYSTSLKDKVEICPLCRQYSTKSNNQTGQRN